MSSLSESALAPVVGALTQICCVPLLGWEVHIFGARDKGINVSSALHQEVQS